MLFRQLANDEVAPDPESVGIDWPDSAIQYAHHRRGRPRLTADDGRETRAARTRWIVFTSGAQDRNLAKHQAAGPTVKIEREVSGIPQGQHQPFGGARRLTLRATPAAWDSGSELQ